MLWKQMRESAKDLVFISGGPTDLVLQSTPARCVALLANESLVLLVLESL